MLVNSLRTTSCCLAMLFSILSFAMEPKGNQTRDVSPIFSGSKLPFSVDIELIKTLPMGVHSGAVGTWEGKWLFIAGRTNGMHAFEENNDNFPPQKQNTDVIVVDLSCDQFAYRSLYDEDSGLKDHEVDLLSVTSPQSYQDGKTLYMTGGYGVVSSTGGFNTKDALTAIDVPGLIHWVLNPSHGEKANHHIRQIFDPIFKITGGYMTKFDHEPTLLVFGQNFEGAYHASSNGVYSKQVRRFEIIDDGTYLAIKELDTLPPKKDELYRRRDLNVVPAIYLSFGTEVPYLVALSGVFTESGGAWTVPVVIDRSGHPSTFRADEASTFKQGMDNYVSATAGFFSKSERKMFTTLFGGISFGYFDGDTFKTDSDLPFINQVTTVRYSAKGKFSQYLMDATYPVIETSLLNNSNPLLFGAGADFIQEPCLTSYSNGVIDLDALPADRTTIGYIVGGIQSTMPNLTMPKTQSSASPYVFKVTLTKRHDS